MRNHKESGIVSLEASISLCLFIFLMLFLYSFYTVFAARNVMGHALLSATNSLSLDAYGSKLSSSGNLTQILTGVYHKTVPDDSPFIDREEWFEDSAVTEEDGTTSQSAAFSSAIKERFVAYLTAGDDENADVILERYNIVGGLDGLDFSKSYIESADGVSRLHIVLTYELEYEFQFFGQTGMRVQQSACSKIWN